MNKLIITFLIINTITTILFGVFVVRHWNDQGSSSEANVEINCTQLECSVK